MTDSLEAFKHGLKQLKSLCEKTRGELEAMQTYLKGPELAKEVDKHRGLQTKLKDEIKQLSGLETEIQKSLGVYAKKTMASPASGMRHFPRYSRRVPVRYSLATGSDKPIRAYTHDIGAMGLFVLTSKMEKQGQMLKLEVDLPDIGTVSLQGTVAWTKWVPPGLRNVQYAGFGVKVTSAPESWFSYFMNQENTGKT